MRSYVGEGRWSFQRSNHSRENSSFGGLNSSEYVVFIQNSRGTTKNNTDSPNDSIREERNYPTILFPTQ